VVDAIDADHAGARILRVQRKEQELTSRRVLYQAFLLGSVIFGCSEAPAAPGENAPGELLNREFEPVVLTGETIPSFAGAPPAQLVGFRYASGAWAQIPIQVDERAVVALGNAYGGLNPLACEPPTFCIALNGALVQLYYTDPKTHIGADPDAAFDKDDELVFMAHDAGVEAPADAPRPPGLQARAGVKVVISEPGIPANRRYVYLFRQNGTLSSGAGKSYVTYNFSLASGEYLASYNRAGTSADANRRTGDAVGANPENTTVTTPFYSQHFADRWILDRIHITAGGASGVDILDRYKSSFAPGSCARTEYTGSRGEGAFIVNRSGPVRAIRAFLGFNSGPLVQRQHIFYEQYSDVTTFLRVHPIPGIVDFFDYSPAATGMTYRNNQNPQGFLIDGRPDDHRPGPLEWESVQGAAGTMVMGHSLATNTTGVVRTSFYEDAITSQYTQCTGDNSAYAASGNWITSDIPNTDPRLPGAVALSVRRQMVFGAPDLTAVRVAAVVANLKAPLELRTAEYP